MIWRRPNSQADEYSYALHQSGHATTLSDVHEECEAIRLLHEAVFEVTGKPVVVDEKRAMGFF